jgi:biopolymer transport protein ExbB
MRLLISSIITLSLALPAAALAAPQDGAAPAAAPVDTPGNTTPAPRFDDAETDMQRKVEASLAELAALRERIASEKLPLVRELAKLEQEIVASRAEFQQVTNLLATRTLDLTKLTSEIKSREEEVGYLSTLLEEYLRNHESGLHITELQRDRADLEKVRLAAENEELPRKELFVIQAEMLAKSLERLHGSFGGSRFAGSAVDATGTFTEGTFFLAGPAALFRSADGTKVGTAEQRLGSLEPSLTAFEVPELVASGGAFVDGKGDAMPFDPTLGNAHKIAQTEETLIEHIKKGGPVMWPIFILAGAALLVVLFKWVTMLFVRTPSNARVRAVLSAVAAGDKAKAVALAEKLPGPIGRMLRAGTASLGGPREAIEEQMYEVMHRTQLKLQSLLPFVAISAAAAPLLGLLGTVTGIMNTFSLITIYGTGDVKTLSSGISEALITTEYGLIVAIPSLLLHAYLSSKSRKIVNRLETAGLSFMNEVAKAEAKAAAPERVSVGAA